VVKHLEHASATAELALSHASNLVAQVTAPERTQWDKQSSPRWTKPPAVVVNPANPRKSEVVRDESCLNEAFLGLAYSAMRNYEKLVFGVLEKLILTTIENLLNKLLPFHKCVRVAWWRDMFYQKDQENVSSNSAKGKKKSPNGIPNDDQESLPAFQISVAIVNGRVVSHPLT
jgi:hypothetical protein